ncbi:transcription-repair coupling factor [Chlamydia trachomatis]|nr:transcription-repair coupling factor [Chlamydia trachomatis]
MPGDNERINLYRELESLQKPQDILRYRQRLEDRFGILPKEAEELLKVVELRMLCKESGIEKVIHKQGFLKFYLVSDNSSSYYRSAIFSTILANATAWGRDLQFKEESGKRTISIKKGIDTISKAYDLLAKLTTK